MDVINHSVHCQCWKCREAKSYDAPVYEVIINTYVSVNTLKAFAHVSDISYNEAKVILDNAKVSKDKRTLDNIRTVAKKVGFWYSITH